MSIGTGDKLVAAISTMFYSKEEKNCWIIKFVGICALILSPSLWTQIYYH